MTDAIRIDYSYWFKNGITRRRPCRRVADAERE